MTADSAEICTLKYHCNQWRGICVIVSSVNINVFVLSFHRLNYRPTWKLNATEPVAENYYPVPTRIYLRVSCCCWKQSLFLLPPSLLCPLLWAGWVPGGPVYCTDRPLPGRCQPQQWTAWANGMHCTYAVLFYTHMMLRMWCLSDQLWVLSVRCWVTGHCLSSILLFRMSYMNNPIY